MFFGNFSVFCSLWHIKSRKIVRLTQNDSAQYPCFCIVDINCVFSVALAQCACCERMPRAAVVFSGPIVINFTTLQFAHRQLTGAGGEGGKGEGGKGGRGREGRKEEGGREPFYLISDQ